jgi:hypothetical protein
MERLKLEDMWRGWFVGDFEPNVVRTSDVEVGVKHYAKGDAEERHFHKVATELTVIVTGRVRMNDQEYGAGDIIRIDPGESTDFETLEDTVTTVVKWPGASDDKYLGYGPQEAGELGTC